MPSKLIVLFFAFTLLLAACGSKSYNVEVDLSSEQEQALLQEIEDKEEEIEMLKQVGESYYLPTVVIAQAYQDLGQIDKTIEVYLSFIDESEEISSAVHNNLGRIYEELGEYDKAIEQYQILFNTFFNPEYLRDITNIYLKIENPQKAQETFDRWKEFTEQTDDFIQKRIDKLLEKQSEA